MKNLRVEAIIIAAGLLLAGLFVYMGFKTFAERDRSVLVKGFAERTVKANKVIWPIAYKTAGNDLPDLYKDVNRSTSIILKYLKSNGIPEKDITSGAPKVMDNKTESYGQTYKDRYNIQVVITVSTDRVELVRKLLTRGQDLLAMGVVISNGSYDNQVTFQYTDLDKIKPTMIEEATVNARQAGEKFAKDSQSKLGKIKQATQGYFSIDDRDAYTPYLKTVKVVTSLEYYLNN